MEQKSTTRKKSSKSRRNSAARKIQLVFRKHRKRRLDLLKTMLTNHTCALENIEVRNENLYMYANLQKGDDTMDVPLFNIFSFTSTRAPLRRQFFYEFYEILQAPIFNMKYLHVFDVSITEDDLLEIVCNFGTRHQEITEEFIKTYKTTYLRQYFLPYIYFILANSKMVLKKGEEYHIEIGHPENASDTAGFHKDESIRTCLTYLNSIVSTELSFDVDQLGLEWLTCSPLFRFNTTQSLYTLCFNDQFLLHSIPIYESPNRSPAVLNRLDEYETFRTRDVPGIGKVGEMGMKQLAPKGRDVFQNKRGEIVKLPQKEKLSLLGNPLPLDTNDPNRNEFLIPQNRKKISKIPERKILAGFIKEDFSGEESSETIITISKPKDILLDYLMISPEEQIRLSQESVDSIMMTAKLGTMALL